MHLRNGSILAATLHATLRLADSPHPGRSYRDAESLLLHLFQQQDIERNKGWLLANRDTPIDPEIVARLEPLLQRRLRGEPLQYIFGQTEFYGLPFTVTSAVLIPRIETEHLVEEVIRIALAMLVGKPTLADIGTGSGAIAVALADALPKAKLYATDISGEALTIALENAQTNHVADRISFFQGDLFAPLAGLSFHIIASNPPYVPAADRDSLSVEVRDHEPHSALFAGSDGLDIYRRLIPDAHPLLHPGGWLVLEIGYGQQPAIHALLESNGYSNIRFIADYQSIPRVALAQSTT